MLRHTISIAFIFALSAVVFGQAKPTLIPGEVVSVASDKIVITGPGGTSDIILSATTEYKRSSTEKGKTLSGATPAALADINVGDKIVASVIPSADGKPTPARTVYLMTKADIAQKHAKETAEWRTRGIAGRVVSIDPTTKAMVVTVGGGMNTSQVTVTAKEKAKVLRYPQDTINFADAKPSSLPEIKAGDQIQALGDRSADGVTLAAEAIVTGAFKQVVGVVESVDAAQNQAVIKDDATGKPVTVSLAKAAMLKRFSPEVAGQMMAMMTGGGVRPPGQGTGNQAAATPPAGPRPGPGGRGGINDLVERAPAITVADLVKGDSIAILISVPNAAAPYGDNVNALKLVAGVEPFKQLARMAAQRGGQQGQGQANLNITIPGLDGGGFQ